MESLVKTTLKFICICDSVLVNVVKL